MTKLATSANETPVFIPAGDGHLFGVMTQPTVTPNGVAVILMFGGIYTLSVNRNRLSVQVARQLASLGYHVLRLDVHGTGESTGVVDEYGLNTPYVEDLEAAADWITEQGIDEFVLVGSCFGGRTCLAGAERLHNLRGVALISTPVLDYEQTDVPIMRISKLPLRRLVRRLFRRHFLRNLLDRGHRRRYRGIARAKVRGLRGLRADDMRKRASLAAMRQLSNLVSEGIPLFMAYGTEQMREEFENAREGRLGEILGREGARVEVRLFDDMRLHGFPSLDAQERAMDLLREWLVVPPIAARRRLASASDGR